jgi:hypothetical protein
MRIRFLNVVFKGRILFRVLSVSAQFCVLILHVNTNASSAPLPTPSSFLHSFIPSFLPSAQVSHLKEHVGPVEDLRVFQDDVHALSVGRDRNLLCWDLRSEKRITSQVDQDKKRAKQE